MRTPTVFLITLLLTVHTACADPSAASKMRPYTGIGILMLTVAGDSLNDPPALYEDPGLSRLGILNPATIPRYGGWTFGESPAVVPLIVTGRKGLWLRVAYDDAGREAWLNPARTGVFQSWDFILKVHVISLLPGLHKKYYQLYRYPGKAVQAQLPALQLLRVQRLEGDWAMVLSDQHSPGWLRWRDEDGRLLIGVNFAAQVMQP